MINSLDMVNSNDWDGPTEDDMAWYLEATYVDPTEREF